MKCTIEQIGLAPPIYAVRVYDDGKSRDAFDLYHNACVAVVQSDGVPEVMLFAIPMEDDKDAPDAARLARQKCREVRLALGEAFVRQGWTEYWRTHPGTGLRVKKECLAREECSD